MSRIFKANIRTWAEEIKFTDKKSKLQVFNRAYSIITNEDDLCKGNSKIKQVLKENGYQERIISKIFKIITSNRSLPESQQQTQATNIQEEEIRISITLRTLKVLVKNYGA